MSEQVREKELRYVSLLEQRIASLEASLAREGNSGGKTISNAEPPGTPEDSPKETDEADGKASAVEHERVRYMTRKWEGGVRVPAVDGKKLEKPSKNVQYERAFTLFTDFDDEDKFEGSYIDIEGEELRTLIRGVHEQYPGIISEARVITLAGPFEALVHNWDALLAAAPENPESEKEKRAKEDLDLLLDSVKKSRELEDYFKVREAHRTAKVTSYEWQWTLFCPGTLVGTKSVRTLPCYPIEYYESVDTENPVEGETCVKDSDDHKDLVFRNESYGSVPVRLWDLLVGRGKKFYELSNSGEGRKRMFRYDGLALFRGFGISSSRTRPDDVEDRMAMMPPGYHYGRAPPTSRTAQPLKTLKVNHNVIIDPESYMRYEDYERPLGSMKSFRGFQAQWMAFQKGRSDAVISDPSDQDFLCTPPRLLGFVPQKKIWAQLLVDNIMKATVQDEDTFKDNLELDDTYADTIWALIKNHESVEQQVDDNRGRKKADLTHAKLKDSVEGKGNGLVLLFHGPPGVGKTLTAELVAEASGKPLFSISVAEIGVRAIDVEKNLDHYFTLAGRWEAVLLIDEADVFLESRTSVSDHERNALVSVMLRVLEYYDGILILTTNRLSSIDIAVLSRLNLAVGYTQLGATASENIWMKFLKRIDFDSDKEQEQVKRLVKKDSKKNKLALNGRQIRNIISSAQAIAKQANRRLKFDDIEQMYDLVG